jgi:hypothetical protein
MTPRARQQLARPDVLTIVARAEVSGFATKELHSARDAARHRIENDSRTARRSCKNGSEIVIARRRHRESDVNPLR